MDDTAHNFTQAATHTPYLVLEGQLKPAQISDPASEFATIEKDGRELGGSSPPRNNKKVKMMLNADGRAKKK